MTSSTFWSAGRYDAVGDRIAPIAREVVDAADARRPLRDAAVVDLACGTGSAALDAAARGARVTGVDITPELIAIAAERDGAAAVRWRTGDASDTGLPATSFDAAVSNMGIIFVEPARQVAEVARLLKPGGVFAFSSWVRSVSNPLFDPVLAVLGPPATSTFSPDQWGDEAVLTERLGSQFDGVDVRRGDHRWEFESMTAAMRFLTSESPMHVETFRRADSSQRARLAAEFEDALRPHLEPSGSVAFLSPYVVVTATLRG
ncbi:class I SAM-dependent methyltransferase [Mycolicibacterium gilvum]|uniref:Type 11 methyltransferase n=1 Tax=Mycolicibacterium gilvum TaxID=1804 RepID=A0A378SJL5_9MYCO|nr:class I SAM-dependent methyltransferase [Mycolicibacterium gilvum]MCV7055025.1 methyltransferase domain-containing protein [Mycolicibacterium gilvum]STZ42338.1 type 11 methyltransferase [Mycolicibacterium gilvum]